RLTTDITKAAGEALTVKKVPHRPATRPKAGSPTPALGLRAGAMCFHCNADRRETTDDNPRRDSHIPLAADCCRNLAGISAHPPKRPYSLAPGGGRETALGARPAPREARTR